MKWFIFFFLLLIAILLESTLLVLPCVFLVLFCFGILFRQAALPLWSFFAGMLLDILTFHTIGMSSLFFLVFFGILFLYERKFEIQSIKFVLVFSFLGS